MLLLYLTIIILGYLIGNFSPAYFYGRIFGKIDIREHGSGNTGATNVIRVLGWRPGVLVFILDIAKGMLAVFAGEALGGWEGKLLAALFVVVGHDFPVILGFRGGKGIAASVGIFLVLFPAATVFGFVLFLLVVALTRMVSVGSLSFMTFMLGYTIVTGQSPLAILLAGILTAFAYMRHWSNIQRIIQGTENKLSFGKLETDK